MNQVMKRRNFFKTLGGVIGGLIVAKHLPAEEKDFIGIDKASGKDFSAKYLVIEKDTCYIRELGSGVVLTKSNDWSYKYERCLNELPSRSEWREFELGDKIETIVVNNINYPISMFYLVKWITENKEFDFLAQIDDGVIRYKVKIADGGFNPRLSGNEKEQVTRSKPILDEKREVQPFITKDHMAYAHSIKLQIVSKIKFYPANAVWI